MKPLLGFARRKNEIAEELEAHLRMATQELIERGMKPEEARVHAIREFGNVPLIEDIATEMWDGCGWIGSYKISAIRSGKCEVLPDSPQP